MASLELIGLTKRFAEVTAVDNVSLSVASGELVAILGASGCGKTTLLRLIAGLERPWTGDVRCDGRSVLGVPVERRGVGFVFQSYALFPHMSVRRNIAYGLRGPRSGARRRVDELLDLVRLRDLASRRPGEISAGQCQRVALARALAPRPRLLLLDEPLSALDAALRGALREELGGLQRALQQTALYVTHDRREAFSLGERVAVMHAGRIEQVGPPRCLHERPLTEEVARLVGSFNVLRARVIGREQGGWRLAVGGGTVVVSDEPETAHEVGGAAAILVREDAVAVGASVDGTRCRRRGDRLRFRGTVREAFYEGDVTVLLLETPLGRLRAQVASEVAQGVGTEAEWEIPQEALQLLKPGGAALGLDNGGSST